MGNQNGQNRGIGDQERNRTNNEFGGFQNDARGRNNDYGQGNADALRQQLQGLYGGSSVGGGPGTIGGALNSSLGLGGSGASGPGPGMSNSFGGDVGVNSAALGNFGSTRGGLEDFASGGGVDATALRQRGTAQIPGFYQQFADSAQKRANAQGGYSPGFDAQQAEIGRQAGRAGFEASRAVEGDIADKVQSGRQFGLQGLSNLGQIETGLNQFNSGQANQIGMFNSGQRQNANQFDTSFGEDNRRFDKNFGEGQRQYNTTGIQRLFDSANNDVGRNYENYYRGAMGRTGAAQGTLGLRQQASPDRTNQLIGGLGQLGGAAIAGSDRNIKENIVPITESIIDKFINLPISLWNYIGDPIKHLGPMAQDMKSVFDVGDGKTIHLVDVMGLFMLLGKELALDSKRKAIHICGSCSSTNPICE